MSKHSGEDVREDVPARLQRLKKPFALGYYHRLKVDGNTALLDAVSGLHFALADDKDFVKALKGIGFVLADPARGKDAGMTVKGSNAGQTNSAALEQKQIKPAIKTFACGVAGSHVVAKPANSEDWRIVDMPDILTPTALAEMSWAASDLPRPTSAVEKVTTFQIRQRRDGQCRLQPMEYGDTQIGNLKRLHRVLKGKGVREEALKDGAGKVGKARNPDVRAFDCGLAGKRFVIRPAGAKAAGSWRIVTRPAQLLPQLGDLDWAASELASYEGPVEKVTRFHIKRVVDQTWRFRPREYDGVRVGRIQRLYRLLKGDVVRSPTEKNMPKPGRQVFTDVVSFDCGIANGHIVMKPSESDSWSVVKQPAALHPAELATQPWATLDLPTHAGAVEKATTFQLALHCNGEWKFRPFMLGNARVGGLQRLCRLLKDDVSPRNKAAGDVMSLRNKAAETEALGDKMNGMSIGELTTEKECAPGEPSDTCAVEKPAEKLIKKKRAPGKQNAAGVAKKTAKNKFGPRVVQKLQAIPAGSQIQIQRGKLASNVAVIGEDGKVTDADKTWNSVVEWALPFKTDIFRCGKHILVDGVQFRNTDYFHVLKDRDYVMVSPEAQMSE